MEKQNVAIEQYPNVDVLGFNLRLRHIEAVEEEGSMDIYFNYDLHREWVEVAEGGCVVESGYEYHPVNISIERVVHEHLGEVKINYLNEGAITYLTKFIHDEIYQDSNGIQ